MTTTPQRQASGNGGGVQAALAELTASIDNRFAAIDRRLKPIDAFLDKPIPAASRGATILGSASRPGPILESSAAGGEQHFSSELIQAEHSAIANLVRTGATDDFEAIGDFMAADGFGNRVNSDPDGGYLVAPVLSSEIQRRAWDVSPLARLARRVTIDVGSVFEEPVEMDDIGAGWVDETEDRPELKTGTLGYLRVPVHEIYTLQPVTQRLLDDSRFNIAEWLEGKISDKFARTEGQAFVRGDGINKAEGFLYRPTSPLPDGERPYFTLQHINTGVGDGFPAASSTTSPADPLIDLVYSLRAPYRPNARWLMNLRTAGVIRKLKDSEGRFIWADAREGQPATLLGFPVEFDEEMPDIGDSTTPVAFGDFRRGYIIVDKVGIRMLTDPYTSKPYVLFYAYRRVGGSIQNGEAIKVLRMAASD